MLISSKQCSPTLPQLPPSSLSPLTSQSTNTVTHKEFSSPETLRHSAVLSWTRDNMIQSDGDNVLDCVMFTLFCDDDL